MAAEPSQPLVLVTLEDGADPGAAMGMLEAAGLRGVDQIQPLPVFTGRPAPGGDLDGILARVRALPRVRGAERDAAQTRSVVPNDPLYLQFQWNLRRIGMERVWELRPSAPELVVAVLDSGVDLNHPELRPNLLVDQGFDFVSDTPLAQDDETHGTAVAGIVGALGNNRQGVAGIAWRVKILPIKVLNAQGRGTNSTLARAIVYAVDRGARILNISSTSTNHSVALERAIGYAHEHGVLVVAAAGNTGDQGNEVMYPAAFDGVVAVGAVDDQDAAAPFSQRGPYLSLVAPGVDVPSTAWPGAGRGQHGAYSGTSIAAPHVSGVAALLWTMRPDLSAGEIAAALFATADDKGRPGSDEVYGAGVINAARAADALRLGIPSSREAVVAPAAGATLPVVPQPPALPSEPRRWYFAEGSTQAPFDTWFALYNPTPRPIIVRFTFQLARGGQVRHELRVEPDSRQSLYANSVLPRAEFGTVVQADGPIFVERSMYFGHDGHTVTGVREPSRQWALAEGSTVAPFDTWVLLLNAGTTTATVRMMFVPESGAPVERVEVVPPQQRRSVYVNLLLTAAGFSTRVESDQPIVVERAMYFDEGQGGHATMATTAPARTWLLAEGTSRRGFDTWVLAHNPGDAPAQARVLFFTDDGRVVPQPLLVPPRGRATLYANLVVPDSTFGVRVESDQPIVVERAIYFDRGRAGFDSTAVSAPSVEWHFAEGATTDSFLEQIALLNPNPQAALVQLEFRRQSGDQVGPRQVRVPANGRVTVDVNAIVLDGQAALRVVADRPIVAERTIYFSRPGGLGATGTVGVPR